MTPAVARRAIALGGVALVGAIIALALRSPDLGRSNGDKALPKPARRWYKALAAPYTLNPARGRTTCGQRIRADTFGVAHAVLPCGVKIYISYGGTRVLTQVIDRGPNVPGREFDVTKALANRIGLHGTQPIRWTYAQ